MIQKKDLLIIIPAYNEEENIAGLLDKLMQPEISDIADIFVINDYSTDNTREIIKGYGIHVTSQIFNMGYGSGLQLGYKYAAGKDYRYLIQMDADGQHDVCNIKHIYDELRKKDENGLCPDIVLGARFMQGSAPFKTSAVKKLAYLLFRFLIRAATGQKVHDPTTGLQGLSRRAFSYYACYSNFDDKYPDANMIMQMMLLGFRVKEIPAVMHERTVGISMHSGLKPVIYMFRMCFSIVAIWIRIKLFGLRLEDKYRDA